jgi:acyl carrier protein
MSNLISERIKSVMGVVFEVDSSTIDDDATPGSIETWDSIRHMNLIVALEEEFNIMFSDDEITDLISFKLIESIISNKSDT